MISLLLKPEFFPIKCNILMVFFLHVADFADVHIEVLVPEFLGFGQKRN